MKHLPRSFTSSLGSVRSSERSDTLQGNLSTGKECVSSFLKKTQAIKSSPKYPFKSNKSSKSVVNDMLVFVRADIMALSKIYDTLEFTLEIYFCAMCRLEHTGFYYIIST